jgi:hypothetical protein
MQKYKTESLNVVFAYLDITLRLSYYVESFTRPFSTRTQGVIRFKMQTRYKDVAQCTFGRSRRITVFWENLLKGQCHENFCFWFFSSVSFPPAPEYPIRTLSNFQKFAETFASQGAPPVSTTPVDNFSPPVSLVMLISVANLPPVPTIPAANLPLVSMTPVQNMETISGCRLRELEGQNLYIC